MISTMRTVFLPLFFVQILLKCFVNILSVLQAYMKIPQAYEVNTYLVSPVIQQLTMVIAQFILFALYKRIPKYVFNGCIFGMLFMTLLMGIFKQNSYIWLPIYQTFLILCETVLFWNLALMVSDVSQAKWSFPIYFLTGIFMDFLLRKGILNGGLSSYPIDWALGLSGVIITAILIFCINYVQQYQLKNLNIKESLFQNFGEVFTNPICLGILFIMIGLDILNNLILVSPQLILNITWGIGIMMLIFGFLLLPPQFPLKKTMFTGFFGCLVTIVIARFYTEIFASYPFETILLMSWPMMMFYLLLFSGFIILPLTLRITGFTYIMILSRTILKLILPIFLSPAA